MILNIGFVQDSILILISGLACLYCWLLNRRLKGLNNLKSGVGATIVSLTDAIQETHGAAKQTLSEITQHMETLHHLIETAEEQAARLEAHSIDLERDFKKVNIARDELQTCLKTDIPHAMRSAQDSAGNLLKTASKVRAYIRVIDQAASRPNPKLVNSPDMKDNAPFKNKHISTMEESGVECNLRGVKFEANTRSDVKPVKSCVGKRPVESEHVVSDAAA